MAAVHMDPVGKRTVDLLHRGLGTTGPSRLGVKLTRRTGWSDPTQQRNLALSAASPPAKKTKRKIASPRSSRQRLGASPRAGLSSRSVLQTPLSARRMRVAETIKVDELPAELPRNRVTWIVSAEHEARHTEYLTVEVNRPRAPRPPELVSVPPTPQSGQRAESPRKAALRLKELEADLLRLQLGRSAKPLEPKEREENDAAIAHKIIQVATHRALMQEQLLHVGIVDEDGDGVIDVFELYTASEGLLKKPTVSVGGRTAEMANPVARRVLPRRHHEIETRTVGSGSDAQERQNIGLGWIRIIEHTGEVFYWDSRNRKAQWSPPTHATAQVRAWAAEPSRGYVSSATRNSLGRRYEFVYSGKAAQALVSKNRAKARKEANQLRRHKAMELRVSAEKQHRTKVLKADLKGAAWVTQLTAEAHTKLVKLVTMIQSWWRVLQCRRHFANLVVEDRLRKAQAKWTQIMMATALQARWRGFRERKRLGLIWVIPYAVYLVIGQPGSGKTSLAKQLAKDYGMIYVNPVALVKGELHKNPGASHINRSFFEPEVHTMVNNIIADGQVIPPNYYMPLVTAAVKKQRMRNAAAPVILDGFPANAMGCDLLEAGAEPFGSAVLSRVFVCQADQDTCVNRLRTSQENWRCRDDAICDYVNESSSHLKVCITALQEREHCSPTKMAIANARKELQAHNLSILRTRAGGAKAVATLEKQINSGSPSSSWAQRQQKLREAIIDVILERETRVCVHWALPKVSRVKYIDCEDTQTPAEAYQELDRYFSETQFVIGYHVSELEIFLDATSEQLQLVHQLSKVEEQSRQDAMEIAALLSKGEICADIQDFASAVQHNEKAYELAAFSATNEERRKKVCRAVRAVSGPKRATLPIETGTRKETLGNAVDKPDQPSFCSADGIIEPPRRWRPVFPLELAGLKADHWEVPINPSQVLMVLNYSRKQKSDLEELLTMRTSAANYQKVGDEAHAARDYNLAIEQFEQGIALNLSTHRYKDTYIDGPTVTKLTVSLETSIRARKIRNQAREECKKLLVSGNQAIAACRFKKATAIFQSGVQLGDQSAENDKIVARLREGIVIAARAKHDYEEEVKAEATLSKAQEHLSDGLYSPCIRLCEELLTNCYADRIKKEVMAVLDQGTREYAAQHDAQNKLEEGMAAAHAQDYDIANQLFEAAVKLAPHFKDEDLLAQITKTKKMGQVSSKMFGIYKMAISAFEGGDLPGAQAWCDAIMEQELHAPGSLFEELVTQLQGLRERMEKAVPIAGSDGRIRWQDDPNGEGWIAG